MTNYEQEAEKELTEAMKNYDKIMNISDKQDLSLAEAKTEYKELVALLNAKTFPHGGDGWSISILNKIDDRMLSLKTIICNYVCKVK